jgi:hypothetical protein
MSKVGRNDPCPCGSGEKYKFCCARKAEERKVTWSAFALGAVLLAAVGGGAVLAFGILSGDFGGREWSAEHGHWHQKGEGHPGPQPPGPVPAGKEWSEEHGHWHDVAAADAGAKAPDEPAPPGKVWSEEHGHWHDADDTAPAAGAPAGDAPPGKVWSEEHGHWHDAE